MAQQILRTFTEEDVYESSTGTNISKKFLSTLKKIIKKECVTEIQICSFECEE